ncbi:MAG: hypothetical protein ABRQ38_06905 [Candidatus Eremiobacterota bacterium]
MSAWLKSGLIFGVINFIAALIFGLLLPACLPPIFIGLGFLCGIVTTLFLNTPGGGLAVKESLKAGIFSTIISTITQILVSSIYFVVKGQKASQQILEQFGQATGSQAEKIGQYVGGLGAIACCGFINIICFIAASAAGALITNLFIKKQNL